MIKQLEKNWDFELISQTTYYVRRKSKEHDIGVFSHEDKARELYYKIREALCHVNPEHGFAVYEIESDNGSTWDIVCKACYGEDKGITKSYKSRGWKIKKKFNIKKLDKKYYGDKK